MRRSSLIFVIVLASVAITFAQESFTPSSTSPVKKFVWKRGTPAVMKHLQAKKQQNAATHAKAKKLPPIIKAELERSQREAALVSQTKAASSVVNTPRNEEAVVAWRLPVLYSLIACVFAIAGWFVFQCTKRQRATMKRIFSHIRVPKIQLQKRVPVFVPSQSSGLTNKERDLYLFERHHDNTFNHASVAEEYAQFMHQENENNNDDEHVESPEAVLTMSLLTRKRETRKKTIAGMITSIRKKENPQHIAESLHVGVGEVQLALNLSKYREQ